MTRNAQILRPGDLAARERGGGARTIPLVNALTGSQQTLSGITEFDPGAQVPRHYHNCEETVILLSGHGIAEIDGREVEVHPWDVSWIPPGVPHFFRNISASEKMRIYWTYSSLDATRTIAATGVTTRIDQEHGVAPR
jgi:quercetin dioxygenase-like cupin family protein